MLVFKMAVVKFSIQEFLMRLGNEGAKVINDQRVVQKNRLNIFLLSLGVGNLEN